MYYSQGSFWKTVICGLNEWIIKVCPSGVFHEINHFIKDPRKKVDFFW